MKEIGFIANNSSRQVDEVRQCSDKDGAESWAVQFEMQAPQAPNGQALQERRISHHKSIYAKCEADGLTIQCARPAPCERAPLPMD
jgi:hypothetical protein